MLTPMKIKRITKKDSAQLVDIETTGNHLFVANDILSHNSAVSAIQHTHEHIAGGISKINESDVYWSILMTDSMRAAGEIAFTFQKTRNSDGVGNTVHLKWDPKTLRILNRDSQPKPDTLTFVRKQNPSNARTPDPWEKDLTAGGLLDIMSGDLDV